MNTRPNPQEDDVVGPAIVRPNHVQDRETSKVAGAPKAWRSASPLEAAYDQGKLQGGDPKYTAEARYNAGLAYSEIFAASEPGSTDSTQALNVSRSSRLGLGNDAAQRAWDQRLCIESHLGQRDRIIIRMVCGEAYWPSEAVRMVCGPDYSKAVSPRFRESLDALIEAIEAARKSPKVFNMAVRP